MGSGIDAALGDTPELAKALDDLKDQLLIVFVNRAGGKVSIPADEIDDTGQFMCSMQVIDRVFHFTLEKKQ